MKEVVCYLLARLGGNDKPTSQDITKILDCVGIKPDEEKLKALFEDLKDLDIDSAIKEGMEKLAVIPSGGGGSGNSGDTQEKKTDAPVEEKEEEEESEKEEQAAPDLFGGDDSSSSEEEESEEDSDDE